MKWIEKLIVPLAIALFISCGTAAARFAVIQADAKAQAEGIPLPILMYHHILKEESRLNAYTISPTEFRADLQYIKDNGYTPIVVQDLIDYVKKGAPLPERPIMITFDDGYESFHEYAFPILQEFRFPAVLAVIGKYADQYSETDDHHIRYSHATWNQIRQMHDSGLVEIQNHSYDLHATDKGRQGSKRKPGENLAAYQSMLTEDLGRVQASCKENLGWIPTTFAYPFGHISSDALGILMDMGFEAAFTCEEKYNYITGDPEQLFHLRRFNRAHNRSAQSLLSNGGK